MGGGVGVFWTLALESVLFKPVRMGDYLFNSCLKQKIFSPLIR
jgi:hypothetical protein